MTLVDIIWGMFGIIVVLGIAFLMSSAKTSIKLRTVLGGLTIQILFAFIVLRWDYGRGKLKGFAEGVQNIISYANEGVSFLFGPAADVEGFG